MRIILVTMLSSVLLSGCGTDQSTAPDPVQAEALTKDSVTILSVAPELTETLEVGSSVKIKYEVEYSLASADTDSLTLVVQSASNETLGNEFYAIHKGSGTETLEADIVVPDTRAVQVFTPLNPQGSESTSVVESRIYKVEQ